MTDAALAALAQRLGEALDARGWTVATAESCTGGWIAKVITDIPGSSKWFEAGFVVYSNAAKRALLDVPSEVIAKHGAVSAEVVAALAENAKRRTDAEIAIAVSGVAGPGGGSAEKPVGTVWFGWADSQGTRTEQRQFGGDRESVRRQSVERALTGLLAAARGEALAES